MADDRSRRTRLDDSCHQPGAGNANHEPELALDWIRPRQLAAIAMTVRYSDHRICDDHFDYHDENDNAGEDTRAQEESWPCHHLPRRP